MNWKQRYEGFNPGDKIRLKPGPIRDHHTCSTSCYGCIGENGRILYVKEINDDQTLHVFKDEHYDYNKSHCSVHPDDCVKVE